MPIRVARKRPDSYQHGDLRAALVQAGLKLLTEGGVPALSLRAAAQLAGVSHAAPYRHFRDKDALIAAIAEEGFRMFTAAMRREMDAAGPDPVMRLRACAWGYVSFARAHPGYFRTMFGAGVRRDCDDATASLDAAGQESYGVLRDQIADGISRGWLRPGDADELSLAAWSLVHGLSLLLIDGQLGGTVPDDATARAVTERLIRLLQMGLSGS
ncbi:MAG TPA: TetR/AcrR family transcriptional regulator [Polyangia bacterium]|nr:TetR/AcrR family transcriptional regulator [Polyangia bacterium]